ncbi:unnamed protein product [Gordionus sp. m RMFG-2023]
MHTKISPNGLFIATLDNFSIKIKSVDDNEEYKIVYKDDIDHYQWSPDSNLIMGLFLLDNMIKIWRLDDLTWNCTIFETLCGFNNVLWSPDSRHIIVIMNHLGRATIWSLTNKSSLMYIKDLKCHQIKETGNINTDETMQHKSMKACESIKDIISFSNNGNYLAVLEESKPLQKFGNFDQYSKDQITIFSLYDDDVKNNKYNIIWKLDKYIKLQTKSTQGFLWSLDDKFICAWEPFYEGIVYIYNVKSQELLKTVNINLLNPSLPSPSSSQTLIRCIWSLNKSDFLVLWCYLDKVFLLNCLTWELLFYLTHPNLINEEDITLIHEETLVKQNMTSSELEMLKVVNGINSSVDNDDALLDNTIPFTIGESKLRYKWESKYVPQNQRPYHIEQLPINTTIDKSKLIFYQPKFSYDNVYLATYNARVPNHLYLWSTESGLVIHVLSHKLPITDFQWNPFKNLLAISTRTQYCFLWTPDRCATYREETDNIYQNIDDSDVTNKYLDIKIDTLKWSPKGTELFAFSFDNNQHNDKQQPYRIIKFTKQFLDNLQNTSSV